MRSIRMQAILMLVLIPFLSFAQDVAGYYIDSNNIRHEVMFRQSNFLDASNLRYRVDNGDFQSLVPEKIKEYGIGNDFKVIRSLVTYNENAATVSSTNISQMKTANLFLNVLVDGNATLYSYNSGGSDIFFYSLITDPSAIKELVYKRYRTSEVSQVYETNTFRNQVFNDLKCEEMDFKDFKNLKYDKSDLVKVFDSYNTCTKNPTVSYSNKSGNHSKFSFSAVANINYTNFSFEHDGKKSDAKSDLSYAAGLELALLFPSHTSSVFLRITYQKFNNETVLPVNYSSHLYNTTIETYTFNASAFNLYAGYRYLFNDHIFADAAVGIIFPSDDIDVVTHFPNAPTAKPVKATIPTGANAFLGLGIGYLVTQNLAIELRYTTPRRIVDSRYVAKGSLSDVGIGLRYVLN